MTRFDRSELNRILTVYGRMVAAGEWRDYALDFLEEVAVFSIFRRASEMPLFRVEKRPKLRGRQGQYCVIAAGGLVMKRGHELAQVLKVFDKKLLQALADNKKQKARRSGLSDRSSVPLSSPHGVAAGEGRYACGLARGSRTAELTRLPMKRSRKRNRLMKSR